MDSGTSAIEYAPIQNIFARHPRRLAARWMDALAIIHNAWLGVNDKMKTQTPRARVGWSAYARTNTKTLRFGFEIRPAFLRHVLATPALAATRGASVADGTLLLSDTVTLGLNDVLVEVWLHPLENSNHVRMEISVTSAAPLPEPLRMTIRWKGTLHTKTLLDGQTSIASVSLSSLQHAPSLRIEFQAGAIGATIEDYRESR